MVPSRRADDPGALKQAIAEVFAEVSASDDDAAGEEAFALLAPIPLETAQAMLGALARSGNHPIGRPAPATTTTSRAAAKPAATTTTTTTTTTTGTGSSATPPASGGINWTWVIIVLIAIGAFVAKGAAGMKKDS